MAPCRQAQGFSYTETMANPCPWCLEPTDRSVTSCTSCGNALRDDEGRELRPVDVRWTRVEVEQWERFRSCMFAGTPVAAVAALAAPAMPVVGPVIVAALAAGHLVVLRLVILGHVMPVLGARRRMLCRWVARLAVLWFGVPGYGAALVPLAGAAVAAATFAGLTTLVHWYGLRSLYRERDRAKPPAWEMALVLALVAITLVVLIAVVVLAALLGWSVMALVTWLGNQL